MWRRSRSWRSSIKWLPRDPDRIEGAALQAGAALAAFAAVFFLT